MDKSIMLVGAIDLATSKSPLKEYLVANRDAPVWDYIENFNQCVLAIRNGDIPR